MPTAKVSACIIVYNHEKFIRDCLDNALNQKVNFDYEIVVSEDVSTDNTRQIVREYQQKYPDKIRLYLNEKNLGLTGNWVQSLRRCMGEYVAICEGDDYWTDPYKLQKQVDFLDAHPDYALSSHNADVVKNGQVIRKYCAPDHPLDIDLERLLARGSGGPTCSMVIRNKEIQHLPEWFSKLKACDWTVQVIAAQSGKMKYFPETMGVYRKHDKGAGFSAKINAGIKGESKLGLPSKYSLEMIDVLKAHFGHQYDRQLNQQSTYWYFLYIVEYLAINDIASARKYAKKILRQIFPLSYWKQSWMTKRRFFQLIFLLLPVVIQKKIRIIYKKIITK